MELTLGKLDIQQEIAVDAETAVKNYKWLEQQLCEYVGVPYCVSMQSASMGLLFALKALDIGAGDSVLCTSFSYFAVSELIKLAGANPVMVDINPNTYNIDPFCLQYVIGKCRRSKQPIPKALIAVDLFGLPCNYDALEEICAENDIDIIEDMAHSFGASFNGKRAGSFGRVAVASFFPAQPREALGDGGAVFCQSVEDERRLKSLRRTVGEDGENNGWMQWQGGSIDSIQTSMVAEKLAMLDREIGRRRTVAQWYRERLDGRVRLQQVGDGYESAYSQLAVSMQTTAQRDSMIDWLISHHIPSHKYKPSPLPCIERDEDWSRVVLVNAKAVSQKLISLPMHPFLSKRVVNFICDKILEKLDSDQVE